MPTPMDAMLGLVVVSMGLLTLVVSFSQADPKKKLVSYIISGVLIALGSYYFVSAELRGFQMRRRISQIQERQSVNMEEIRKRLDQNQPVQPKKNP